MLNKTGAVIFYLEQEMGKGQLMHPEHFLE
jgi:hypothetical protein